MVGNKQKILVSIFILAVLGTIPSANCQSKVSEPVELTTSNFDEFTLTNNKGTAVVFFGAEWCGHCTNFKPIYKELHNQSSKIDGLVFYTHFQTGGDQVARRFKIRGYPTIVAIKGGKYWTFKQKRDKETVLKWAQNLEGEGVEFPTSLPGFIQEFKEALEQEYQRNPKTIMIMGGIMVFSFIVSLVMSAYLAKLFWENKKMEKQELKQKNYEKVKQETEAEKKEK